MPKYGAISGQLISVFSPNTGKYRPEITPYLDTFRAVKVADWVVVLSHINAGKYNWL